MQPRIIICIFALSNSKYTGKINISMSYNRLFRKLSLFFFPFSEAERRLFFLFSGLFFFKFLWFDFGWCMISTFRPFSAVETYLYAALATLVLLFPLVVWRMERTTWVIAVLLDMLHIANLMYFRTYYTAIPLDSYALIGNMKDFTDSVWGSLKGTDAVLPLSTLVAALFRKKMRLSFVPACLLRKMCGYLAFTGGLMLILGGVLSVKGGFKKAYESLQDSYTHTCVTPMYTVFGSLYYDYIRGGEVYTPEIGMQIKTWLNEHVSEETTETDALVRTRCILILAESLESWVLEESVEGQELMPYLNRLLKDSTTIYAPYVLSQVKGGRSIDAQLMINTGLLPIDNGVYSLKYPHSTYPSLVKAMKEKYGASARAYTLTGDKPVVWNQCVIEPAFGYDALLSRADFVNDEPVGPSYRPQIGDRSLMRQIAGKIAAGEVWDDKGQTFLQCVTYSGHFPFVLPKHLQKVSFSDRFPSRMRDYMMTANYTDRAIGMFIERLKEIGAYENTLIVITGDHEGLVDMRREWCATAAGKGIVSEQPMVPLIILNAPKGMRYEKVMGQIDIYPTLLQLMGLTGYWWKGLGESILSPSKQGVAIDPHGKIYGDKEILSDEEVRHLKDAWSVSDAIIRYDYFRRRND